MDKNTTIALVFGVIALGAFFYARKSRGHRNNNPLNIKYNPSNNWQGQTGTDGKFAIFSSPEYGIRAAYKILATYNQRGINRLRDIVATWAPSHENPTANYVNFVAKKTGYFPDTIISPGKRARLLHAMAQFEGAPVSVDTISRGIRMV